MRITLKQLVVFDAVARIGSIGQAADEVALSQSATSMSLQDLERNLGVPLFHRYKKKLTLNENGRRLQPQAKSVIQQARDIEVSPHGSDLQGQLLLGVSPVVGQYIIPKICRDFLLANPQVKIHMTMPTTQDIITRVDSSSLDVGLIEAPVNRPSLSVMPLGNNSLKIFCSPEHKLALLNDVSVEDLKGQTWYLPTLTSVTRQTLTMGIGQRIGQMNIAFESDSVEAIKQAVKGSNALSCLPSVAVEQEFRQGTLAQLPVADMNLTRSCNMLFRTDVYHANVQKAFIDYAAKMIPLNLI